MPGENLVFGETSRKSMCRNHSCGDSIFENKTRRGLTTWLSAIALFSRVRQNQWFGDGRASAVGSLWDEGGVCFDTDDGSLPGIEVAKLSPAGVSAVYAMLRRRSRPSREPPEFWSRTREQSVQVDTVPDAAGLVAAGEAEAFHHCIEGVAAGGVELPVLGVFVWPAVVELDYRMGREWGSGPSRRVLRAPARLLLARPGGGRSACGVRGAAVPGSVPPGVVSIQQARRTSLCSRPGPRSSLSELCSQPARPRWLSVVLRRPHGNLPP